MVLFGGNIDCYCGVVILLNFAYKVVPFLGFIKQLLKSFVLRKCSDHFGDGAIEGP
jgi:hypothetical protein